MYTSIYRPPAPPRHVLVTELEHAILIRKGRVRGSLGPGRHRLRRRTDRLWIEPATPQVMVIPSQEILTSDGVTVKVTVTAVVRIVDADRAMRAGDWRSRFHLEVQMSLRAAVTSIALEALIENRTGLDRQLQESLDGAAVSMGLAIDGMGLRDLVATGEVKRQLSEVVAARLAGQAALERARGETAALRSLANAASLVKDNPELYRLRLLQEMGSSSGHTFVVDTDPPRR